MPRFVPEQRSHFVRQSGQLVSYIFALDKKQNYLQHLHRDFACQLYRAHLQRRPSQERVNAIVSEAVEIERKSSLPSLLRAACLA